ncbi:hypothetical protein D3C84_864370 [compost metagenome]
MHAIGVAADDTFEGFAVQYQGAVGVGVFAFLDFAGAILDDQGVVLVFVGDVETEHQVKTGSSGWVELGFHRFDGFCYIAHGVFLIK